ncbi:redoxin domain-containing protein [soil metagenome]
MLRTLLCLVMTASTAVAADSPKVGDTVGKLTFTDIRSLPRTLDDFGKNKATVLVFTSTTCPLVKRYLPTLKELHKEYTGKGVQFAAVNAADEDTLIQMATQAVKFDVPFPFVKDFNGSCVDALGVKRTPEVVVLDAAKRIVYRGRIDDQFRLGGNRKEATTHELKDAIDAVLSGKAVAVAETEVDGCPITRAIPRKHENVNFAEHIAPILKTHCWQCHRDGGSAPFSLTTFKSASTRAKAINEVIQDQRMPPWFASHDFGPFANVRGLTENEKTILKDWAKTGTAAGDEAKMPAAPKATDAKWKIGEPDLVLKTTSMTVAATGDIAYQYAILPHLFTEDTWVKNVQILPDNPKVMHHCNMAWGNLAAGFSAKNFITGQVPNGEPMDLDPGVAVLIPKNSVLALEIHYVSTGQPEKCRISVGLNYPKEPIQRQLKSMQLESTRFAIPPGDPHFAVKQTRTLSSDADIVGLFSHMHLRGKDMTFTATTPDGKVDEMLIIANYNFGWQIPYRYEPGKKVLPKGTRLECVAHFDNSPFNPYNPDPKKTVRWGHQTHDEMMMGFVFYTDAGDKLNLNVDPKTGVAVK